MNNSSKKRLSARKGILLAIISFCTVVISFVLILWITHLTWRFDLAFPALLIIYLVLVPLIAILFYKTGQTLRGFGLLLGYLFSLAYLITVAVKTF